MPAQRFADLRAPEIATRITERSIMVLPVGAIEQHGPHLPLATDCLIADAVANAALDRIADDPTNGIDAWLLPSIAVSKSNEHAWSPGTLWLSADTFMRVVDDIGRCVATTACTKLVFLNGHGGNSSLLNVLCRELRLTHGLRTFLAHAFVPPDQGGAAGAAARAANEMGMGIHGGLEETSVVLHLAPDLVDMSQATRNVPEHLAGNGHVRFGGSVSFGWLSSDFGPDGHIGDPTGATAEIGAALFEAAFAAFVGALGEIDRWQ